MYTSTSKTRSKKPRLRRLKTIQRKYPLLVPLLFFIVLFTPTFFVVIFYNSLSGCDTVTDSSLAEVSRAQSQSQSNVPDWISHRLLSLPSLPEHGENDFDDFQHSTIFVGIASFRDPECKNTIYQIFEKARFPDRIRVGIFQQNNITADPDCADFKEIQCELPRIDDNHVLCGRLHQIKIDRVHWNDCLGPTYGRYRSELLYNGEDFVLQMDSHTALAPDWDIVLIDMWKRIGNEYAVLTTYPRPLRSQTLAGYDAPPVKAKTRMYVICSTNVLKDKLTKSFKLTPARVVDNQGYPILTAYFAAGFSFQRGHRLINVPYDPYAAFLFDGEEMSMAVRMWTHGYDFYAPDRDVAYHLYSPNAKKIRPVFWETEWNVRWKIARESEYRINYIMGLHQRYHPAISPSQMDLREVDKYGCGKHRNKEDFWKFARIDLVNLTSEDLCPLYGSGGMQAYRVPWIDSENDPFSTK